MTTKRKTLLFKEKQVHKIAVFRALQLGDMLCSVPALRSLRAAYPKAEITLIGLPWAKEFARRFSSYIDRFLPFPGYPGLPEQSIDSKNITRFIATMQQQAFDLVIQMHGNGLISNPLISLFGAVQTAGYYSTGQYCPNPQTFMPYLEKEHEIQRHLSLMGFLGIPTQGEALEFPIFHKDLDDLQAMTGVDHLQPNAYICIHPGAVSSRRWPEKKFARIADVLSLLGLPILLTGTAAEAPIVKKVLQHMKHPALDLSGKTTLGMLGILIQNAALLISNDTGPSHIAAALQTPSVIIFTSSNPVRWAPLNRLLHRSMLEKEAAVSQVISRAYELLNYEERHMKQEKTYPSPPFLLQNHNF